MKQVRPYTILGAGLTGISTSHHLGHENCNIFEKNDYLGGHIHSERVGDFTWDEGPHVSFTKSQYVIDYFNKYCSSEILEYPVSTVNYFRGNWIPHPAQSNLFAIPEPLRSICFDDLIQSRSKNIKIETYKDWLIEAFGEEFYKNFPLKYTKKYWTVDPDQLTTDWVGNRVFYPSLDEVREGYKSLNSEQTHYIKTIRYPKNGGYFSFVKKAYDGANIDLNNELKSISFEKKIITFNTGEVSYDKLISTLPLPELILKSDAPDKIRNKAKDLNCSSLLVVNVIANHPTQRKDNWIYVYDEDKYSTRINCTELLSPENGVQGKTGVQVEVYFSDYKPKNESDNKILESVIDELIEMKLIKDRESVDKSFTRWISHANVIFDKKRREAQNIILQYLEDYGLKRESDDLEPMTNWDKKENEDLGDLILAGRFGQWKYFWTDDCILRSKFIGDSI